MRWRYWLCARTPLDDSEPGSVSSGCFMDWSVNKTLWREPRCGETEKARHVLFRLMPSDSRGCVMYLGHRPIDSGLTDGERTGRPRGLSCRRPAYLHALIARDVSSWSSRLTCCPPSPLGVVCAALTSPGPHRLTLQRPLRRVALQMQLNVRTQCAA